MKPAVVKFIGDENEYRVSSDKGISNDSFCRGCRSNVKCNEKFVSLFTKDKLYEAYLVEFWEGKRDSLHVRANDGNIHDFVYLGDFEVLSDPSNVLNMYEALVKCTTHAYDELFDLNYGKIYKAIGRAEDGYYLVMDESYYCYYYKSDCFEIVGDPHHILDSVSLYQGFTSGLVEELRSEEYRAHSFCSNHRPELSKDKKCGCFSCLSIFDPAEIEEWIEADNAIDKRGTAICPHCDVDAVIGESSGYPITKDFLSRMHKRWFE